MFSIKKIFYKQKKWTNENGTICFTVSSKGKTGSYWSKYYKKSSTQAHEILNSIFFKPYNKRIYNVQIIQGDFLNNGLSTISQVKEEGLRKGLVLPPLELACIIRKNFSQDELAQMGLMWVITMHEPVDTQDFGPRVLYSCRECGGPIHACSSSSNEVWGKGAGFAFLEEGSI